MRGCQWFVGYVRVHGACSLASGLVVLCSNSVHQPRPYLQAERQVQVYGVGLHSLAVGPVHLAFLFAPNRGCVVSARLPFVPVALWDYLH